MTLRQPVKPMIPVEDYEKLGLVSKDLAQQNCVNTEKGNNLNVNLEIDVGNEKVILETHYKFKIEDIKIENNVSTIYGIKNRVSIKYLISTAVDEEELQIRLVQKYNISNNSKSNFYKIYKALTGKVPIGKINLGELMGIKGDCEVKNINMDDGSFFPKIVNLNAEIKEE